MNTTPTGKIVYVLAITYNYSTEVEVFDSEELAQDALMRDVYETYQDFDDLPETYDPAEISEFIGSTGDSYLWTIAACNIIGKA